MEDTYITLLRQASVQRIHTIIPGNPQLRAETIDLLEIKLTSLEISGVRIMTFPVKVRTDTLIIRNPDLKVSKRISAFFSRFANIIETDQELSLILQAVDRAGTKELILPTFAFEFEYETEDSECD